MLKRSTALALTVFSLLPATTDARVVERIVAVVGNQVILQSEVEQKAAPFLRQIASITDQTERAARAASLRREVLDRLIDDELIDQQAKEMKLTVSSGDIDNSIKIIQNENNLTDEQLREAVSGQGMTWSAYRKDVKSQILRYRVLQMAVGAKTQISDREVEEYYNRHMKKSDYEVRASHIFLAIPADADTGIVLEKRHAADELRKRAESGEDFDKLARAYSEDPATRDDGGDLGFFGKDLLPKAIEEVVFNMEVGQIRGPVRAERGFHVILLADKREKDARKLDEVRNEIRARLRQKAAEKETKSFLTELRGRVLVDIRM